MQTLLFLVTDFPRESALMDYALRVNDFVTDKIVMLTDSSPDDAYTSILRRCGFYAAPYFHYRGQKYVVFELQHVSGAYFTVGFKVSQE
uniref:Uncharacterized protein n=1 Tax=Panagrolaimus superbus TaxID=310955 RepID=A0A914Z059_9BILA